jgi:tripartite-type tricarboxylate transporter receptor subunit TctC
MKDNAMYPITRRAALSLAGASLATPALAQPWPGRPIRFIVPYTPGGTTDIATRLLAEPLSRALGQPVVVENRPGANSIVGAAATAGAPADGYTFAMVLPAHAANATMQAGRLPFDVLTSFAPVTLMVTSPLVLAGAKQIPAQDLRGYMDYVRRNPGRVNYGSSGIGATAHMAMEMLKMKTGLQMEHVPYRGTQPALADLMAGHIGLMFDTISGLKPHFESGAIRNLGFSAEARPSFAPDVPTLAEAGVPDVIASTWCMVLAPAGTPAAITQKVAAETHRIVREPAMAARLHDLGFIPEGTDPERTATFLRSEVERWGAVIRAADIRAE